MKEQNAFFPPSLKPLCYFVPFPSRKSSKCFGFYNGPDFTKFTAPRTADATSTPQDQRGREISKRCSFKSGLMEASCPCASRKCPRTTCHQQTRWERTWGSSWNDCTGLLHHTLLRHVSKVACAAPALLRHRTADAPPPPTPGTVTMMTVRPVTRREPALCQASPDSILTVIS